MCPRPRNRTVRLERDGKVDGGTWAKRRKDGRPWREAYEPPRVHYTPLLAKKRRSPARIAGRRNPSRLRIKQRNRVNRSYRHRSLEPATAYLPCFNSRPGPTCPTFLTFLSEVCHSAFQRTRVLRSRLLTFRNNLRLDIDI